MSRIATSKSTPKQRSFWKSQYRLHRTYYLRKNREYRMIAAVARLELRRGNRPPKTLSPFSRIAQVMQRLVGLKPLVPA